MDKLKLFVWHNVLIDYTDGIMFALAHTEEEAREVILKEGGGLESVEKDLAEVTPTVYETPVGFYLYGGG